jgi:hypothetical protein
MIRRLLVTALLAAALPLSLAVAPAEAALPSKKQWLSDVDDAMTGSWTYIDRQVAHRAGRRLAINLDIDNTSLATKYDYGAPVRRVLRFTRHARSQGVVLLFNTGRVQGDGRLVRAKRQLTRAGYVVTAICGRVSKRETLTHSKQRCRARFVAAGWTITANVGNRRTDLTGGHYDRAFRLPNYSNRLG